MPHFARTLGFGAFALLLCAGLTGAPGTWAQTPDDDEDSDSEEIPPTLTVTASIEDDGKAIIYGFAFGQAGQAEPKSDLNPVIDAAFGCVSSNNIRHFKSPGVSYFGSCRLPASRTGLLHLYRIKTKPLRDYAVQHHLESISVQLTLPDTEVRETLPASNGIPYAGPLLTRSLRRHFEALRSFSWRTDAAIPDFIEIRAGFNSAATLRRALLLLAALFAPVLLALWLRRRALRAQIDDNSSIWFSYIRYQQWILTGSLVLWWAAAESARLNDLLRFLLQSDASKLTWFLTIASTLFTWIPPGLVCFICVLISHPVQEKLRGLRWTRKELALQSVYSLTSTLLPLALIIIGLDTIARGEYRVMVLFFAAAIIVKMVAQLKLVNLLGMQPQALTVGELRDAAFAMAARLNVKLQQIYVIPAGKGQMANAFARTGNSIGFTDYLLHRMTQREVNYVLAHELTHLRLKHLQKLAFAIIGGITLGTFVRTFEAGLWDSTVLQWSSMILIASLFTYFWSRRFEFSADAGAVEATADPEAAISALHKLASLNMHPLHWSKWSEKWLTHPSTLRRAQAIAKKASIPFERFPEIARAAVQDDNHYTIPASATAGHKLDSTTTKTGNMLWIGLSLLGAMILVPTAFALLVKFAPLAPSLHKLVYFVGAIVSVAAFFALANRIAPRKLHSLIPLLKEKLDHQGVRVASWQGAPVGLAPAAVPRLYESHTHWDLGFLFLREDHLCYWGEETKFALRRDQITAIKLGPTSPNWFRTHAIYIAWRDLDRSTCGVFSVGSAEPRTILQLRKRTTDLFGQILQWHKISSTPKQLPAPLDSLETPQFGSVTGVSPLQLRKPQRVLKELYLSAFLAGAVAIVAGLPFHLLQFLFQRPGLGAHLNSPGPGWYVVAVAAGLRFINYVPLFFYKEKPVVEAELSASSHTKAVPPSQEAKSQPEPVFK